MFSLVWRGLSVIIWKHLFLYMQHLCSTYCAALVLGLELWMRWSKAQVLLSTPWQPSDSNDHYMLGLHAGTTCQAWGQWFDLSGGDQYTHFTYEETGLRAIKQLVQAHKRWRVGENSLSDPNTQALSTTICGWDRSSVPTSCKNIWEAEEISWIFSGSSMALVSLIIHVSGNLSLDREGLGEGPHPPSF